MGWMQKRKDVCFRCFAILNHDIYFLMVVGHFEFGLLQGGCNAAPLKLSVAAGIFDCETRTTVLLSKYSTETANTATTTTA